MLYGGTGRDFLTDRKGRNRLVAGPGNDGLYAWYDRQRDVLNCGKGFDRVLFIDELDEKDRLINCERVRER